LIALISNKSDLILDPFAGSSSLGEAALQTERRAVLVEQDMEFYETGASRISEVESSLANIFD
jgi:DNA modification methylase